MVKYCKTVEGYRDMLIIETSSLIHGDICFRECCQSSFICTVCCQLHPQGLLQLTQEPKLPTLTHLNPKPANRNARLQLAQKVRNP